MEDLIAWLRAQLDEDERVIRGWASACVHVEACFDGSSDFLDRFTEDRMLAEVDAKRQLMELHRPVRKRSTGSDGGVIEDCKMCDHFPAQYPCATMRLLALPYADRSGYRQEWAPTD